MESRENGGKKVYCGGGMGVGTWKGRNKCIMSNSVNHDVKIKIYFPGVKGSIEQQRRLWSDGHGG